LAGIFGVAGPNGVTLGPNGGFYGTATYYGAATGTTGTTGTTGIKREIGSYQGGSIWGGQSLNQFQDIYDFGSSPTTGYNPQGTVTIDSNGSAPGGGAVVTLASSSSAATVPSSITIPVGQSSAKFSIQTTSVVTAKNRNSPCGVSRRNADRVTFGLVTDELNSDQYSFANSVGWAYAGSKP
jgi:hypothetical protein